MEYRFVRANTTVFHTLRIKNCPGIFREWLFCGLPKGQLRYSVKLFKGGYNWTTFTFEEEFDYGDGLLSLEEMEAMSLECLLEYVKSLLKWETGKSGVFCRFQIRNKHYIMFCGRLTQGNFTIYEEINGIAHGYHMERTSFDLVALWFLNRMKEWN